MENNNTAKFAAKTTIHNNNELDNLADVFCLINIIIVLILVINL